MKQLYSEKFEKILAIAKRKLFSATLLPGIILLLNVEVFAAVTITRASLGTGITADNAANAMSPAYTTLGNIIVTEGISSDFSTGTGVTFTLNCPSGWTFNPLSAINATASAGGDISSVSVASISTTLIIIQITVTGSTNPDALTIAGIEVRANDGGNVPGTTNITRGGSAVISGCTAGANMGFLSQSVGVIDKLVITLPGQTFSDANNFATSGNAGSPVNQTAGTNFIITKIRACDQFFNVVTGYSGIKSLTFSGPTNGLTPPSYTTNVSFASGVSSTILNTILKRAETTILTVSDGTITGPTSSSITVIPGAVSNFRVEAAGGGNIGSQVTGMPFNISITARDANNNICSWGLNSFNGTADITSTGTLSWGSGTTSSFSAGVLSTHSVTISNQGNFTLTATRTGNIQSGTSNIFTVSYPPGFISTMTPNCVTPGDPGFVLIVNGNNFDVTSIVRFNNSDRATSFINSTQLNATILTSDIALPGIYSITVFTPGAGAGAPVILNMNTESTNNVSICQGETYILPDGIPQTTDGTYLSLISGSGGCDSLITTNLTVTPAPERTENITICPGTSYILPDGTPQSTAGTYYSMIPTPPGCDSIITTNLSLHQSPVLTATPVQIDCFGNTGSVMLNASNGLAPYTYGPEATTNLTAGTYNFMVTDDNGCIGNASATIDPAPAQLLLTATPSQINCFGGNGSVNLSASGGTPGYSYGGDPTSNLTAGNYNYEVTDNNGCTASAPATINPEPSVLSAITSATNTPCGSSTGTASVIVSGGVSPYSYSWNTTPVSNSISISGLSAGTYTITATDANGCTVAQTASVNYSNTAPIAISGGTGVCPGGTLTICATAGFSSYLWSTGETTQCITVNSVDTFTVVATDNFGCTGSNSTITHNSTLPNCSITGGVLCPNSTLRLNVPMGYPYYFWSNGAKTYYTHVRNAGTYSVAVRNSDGCESICSFTVGSPLRSTVTKIDGKCTNEFKGSASVMAFDGTPPYSYLWSNGDTTATISGLTGGNYAVRVTDSGGCTLTKAITVYSNKTTYDYTAINTSFNNIPVSPGSYIWFSLVANINYIGNYPVTIRFTNQNIYSSAFNLFPANAKLIITNAVSQSTTSFTGGEWVTTAPPNLAGNYFVSGYAYQVSTPVMANLYPVRWNGIWASSSSCVTNIAWKWSAAAYSNLNIVNTLLDIKPVDDPFSSPYNNNDPAGTPDNYKVFCIAGAKSTGAPEYTGALTLTANRIPCSTVDICQSQRLASYRSLEPGSNFMVKAYPNPFNSKTNIEFLKFEKSGHLTIDIYSMYGQKIRTIFDSEVDPGVQYTVEFDAGDLASGIYIYILRSVDEEIRGKLQLER